MNKILKLITLYNLFIVSSLIVFGFKGEGISGNILLTIFLLPVGFYFLIKTTNKIIRLRNKDQVIRFLAFYSFIFVNLLFVSLIINLKQTSELLFVLFFAPLEFYFINTFINTIKESLLGKNNQIIYPIEANVFDFNYEDETIELEKYEGIREVDKRKFFKLMAGAGLGVFVAMLLNPQKAGAAFFGSVPGPGTIGVKDSTGTLIDPAIKSPTDGYGIMNTDESSYPYYYGFVNKDGGWYIVKSASDGSFTYVKGNSGYDWSNRASETYASFDSVF